MVTLADIEAAAARIRNSVRLSPCSRSETLSKRVGASVSLKLENLQITGSYKERGALNKLLTLTSEEAARGLVAASAGNHAQAVAYHAARQGIRAHIWMPVTTPLIKVSATRNYGAEVKLYGANYDEAYEAASECCRQGRRTFVHPFDDDAVVAGQGTLALELLEQSPDLELIVVPVGGGGLIGGIACAIKETSPKIRVVGVQTARMASMPAALHAGKPVTIPAAATLADGIAVRKVGDRTLPLVEKYVDELITVDEEEIATAILYLLEQEKTVAEGGGAVGVAAILHDRIQCAGKRTVAVISGGNIDVTLLSRIIERGLVKDGRMVRLRIHLPDFPGALHRLTGVIAQHRANIVQTSHDRAHYGVSLGQTVIDINLETRGQEHIEELTTALTSAGYRHHRIH